MISYKNYYLQQFKDIPKMWVMAKKHKKYRGFILAVLLLLFPLVIRIMWLYDTKQIELDKRFNPKVQK